MSILTYIQYAKIKHPIPYKVVLRNDSNSIFYFGERHSFDVDNPQWQILRDFWVKFLKETENKKRVVFIEGGVMPVAISEEDAIVRYGGTGLVRYLAHQQNIEAFSPEPDQKYERSELEKQFSRDLIQYYYFARVVLQWNRKSEPRPDFVEYVTRFLKRDEEKSGWTGYDFSFEHMKQIHASIFNQQFDELNKNFFYNITNPVDILCEINKVAVISGFVRDYYIVDKIKQYIEDGYSIYVEYGSNHAVMQEPALKELLGSKE